MNNLYQRQETLNLNTNQSITIAGLGGIGYWVAKYLVMSGIEKLYLFDPDVIELSNLNRLDLPINTIGLNKADITRDVVVNLRPESSVISMPFKLQEHTFPKSKWCCDCTDNLSSQIENKRISDLYGSKYMKVGYNGEHITISNTVAEWGEAPDGYTVTPSWVVPSSIIASLAVSKMLKYTQSEISCDLKELFF